MTDDGELVRVRRQWNDSESIGHVPADRLRDFHWRREGGGYASNGGFGNTAPRPFLHARMWCDALVSGAVGHSCLHGPPPHEILVCITKKDNAAALFNELTRRARNRQETA